MPTKKDVEVNETAEQVAERNKVARLERELAERSVPQGYKQLEDCSKEELVGEIKRLTTSVSALKQLIKDFIDKL